MCFKFHEILVTFLLGIKLNYHLASSFMEVTLGLARVSIRIAGSITAGVALHGFQLVTQCTVFGNFVPISAIAVT